MTETNRMFRQRLVAPGDRGSPHWEDLNYLVAEFSGNRVDTDRYSRADRVRTTVYVACFKHDDRPEKSLYFTVIAMVPVETPETKRLELISDLETFLQNV